MNPYERFITSFFFACFGIAVLFLFLAIVGVVLTLTGVIR